MVVTTSVSVVVAVAVTSLIISDVTCIPVSKVLVVSCYLIKRTVVKTSDIETSIEVIDSISVILLKISDVTWNPVSLGINC